MDGDTVFLRIQIHDRQKIRPPAVTPCGLKHHPAGIAVSVDQIGAGRNVNISGCDITVEQLAFDSPAELAARNHFLSGITAFRERKPAGFFQIDHLRNETVLYRQRDVRHTRFDIAQRPAIHAANRQFGGECVIHRLIAQGRNGQQVAGRTESIGHAYQHTVFVFGLAVHDVRQVGEPSRKRRGGTFATDAGQPDIATFIGQDNLRAQNINLKPFFQRVEYIGRQAHPDLAGGFPYTKTRQHAALRGAIRGQTGAFSIKMVDVVAELAVDETHGIFAFQREQAGLIHRNDITGCQHIRRAGKACRVHGFHKNCFRINGSRVYSLFPFHDDLCQTVPIRPFCMKQSAKRKILIAVAMAIAAVSLAVIALFCWAHMPVFGQGKPVDFEIAPGATVKSVTTQLAKQDVPLNETMFIMLVRLTGNSTALRAGPYELKAGETPARLLEKITKGIFAMESLTIIEGWNFRQMRQAVARHPALKHETAGLSERELLKKLGIDHRAGEGLFFPDTYLFRRGAEDMQIYRQAHEAMMMRLNALWEERDPALPYKTPYEALVMASIIEKETAHPGDRDMISGVFANRLKIGMKLQTDPTVIYGMGERYKGKIRKIDLRTDTPYNTYTRYGLPPTPIALPGGESLEAAFYPAETDALYFVARGDGTSHFSRSLDEHNRAVDKYIR